MQRCTGRKDLPKVTELAKTDPGFRVTTLPTLPAGPLCSLWHAPNLASRRYSIVVPLFPSPESAAEALAIRSRGGGYGRGHGEGREGPILGHMVTVWQVMQTVSPNGLQPLAVCPNLKQVHQASLCTYPSSPIGLSFTPTRFGHRRPTPQAQDSEC